MEHSLTASQIDCSRAMPIDDRMRRPQFAEMNLEIACASMAPAAGSPGKRLLTGAAKTFIVDYRYIDHRLAMPKRILDPLPFAAFQILLSLAEQDLHGYAIMRQVAEQTGGRMRLGPGTLYSSIQTLLEAKFIEEVGVREDAKLGQERRRYYRLTAAGRKRARSEAERLGDLLRVARARKIFRGEYV